MKYSHEGSLTSSRMNGASSVVIQRRISRSVSRTLKAKPTRRRNASRLGFRLRIWSLSAVALVRRDPGNLRRYVPVNVGHNAAFAHENRQIPRGRVPARDPADDARAVK